MILFLDIDSRALLDSKQAPFRRLDLKRRDTDSIELQFLRNNIVQELPTGTTIRLGIKADGAYAGSFLATTSTFAKSGTGTSTKYLADLNLNTTDLNTAFSSATPPEPDSLPAMLEVEWTSGTNVTSSKTLPVTIANDVIRGNEGTPATLPLFYTSSTSNFLATQAEAEAGTDNTKWMSPLRTKQAIQKGPLVVNENGKTLTISPQKIESNYGADGGNTGTIFNFAENKMTLYGSSVMEWSDNYLIFPYEVEMQGTAYINTLYIANLNHPVTRLTPQRFEHNFTSSNQNTALNLSSLGNQRYVITSTNLTADVSVVVRPGPGSDPGSPFFGDILRIQWSRTGHTRALLLRHHTWSNNTWSTTPNVTVATLSAPGVYGFVWDGSAWVTEAAFTGL